MVKKYRFVKETFPDRVRFSTERMTEIGTWAYVPGTVTNDEYEGRDLYTKVLANGCVPVLEVLEESP